MKNLLKNCLLILLLVYPCVSRAQQTGVYDKPVDKNYQVYVLSVEDHKSIEDLNTKLDKDILQVTTDKANLETQEKTIAYKYSKRVVNLNDYSSTYQYFGKYLIYCIDDYKCEGIHFTNYRPINGGWMTTGDGTITYDPTYLAK